MCVGWEWYCRSWTALRLVRISSVGKTWECKRRDEHTTNPLRITSQCRGDCGSWFQCWSSDILPTGAGTKTCSTFCSYRRLRSDHILTTAYWDLLFSQVSVACLVHFWFAPEYTCCIHTCTNEPHQMGEMHSSLINQNKWGWRESTHRENSLIQVIVEICEHYCITTVTSKGKTIRQIVNKSTV